MAIRIRTTGISSFRQKGKFTGNKSANVCCFVSFLVFFFMIYRNCIWISARSGENRMKRWHLTVKIYVPENRLNHLIIKLCQSLQKRQNFVGPYMMMMAQKDDQWMQFRMVSQCRQRWKTQDQSQCAPCRAEHMNLCASEVCWFLFWLWRESYWPWLDRRARDLLASQWPPGRHAGSGRKLDLQVKKVNPRRNLLNCISRRSHNRSQGERRTWKTPILSRAIVSHSCFPNVNFLFSSKSRVWYAPIWKRSGEESENGDNLFEFTQIQMHLSSTQNFQFWQSVPSLPWRIGSPECYAL